MSAQTESRLLGLSVLTIVLLFATLGLTLTTRLDCRASREYPSSTASGTPALPPAEPDP